MRGIGHRNAKTESHAEIRLRNGEEALGQWIAGGKEQGHDRQADQVPTVEGQDQAERADHQRAEQEERETLRIGRAFLAGHKGEQTDRAPVPFQQFRSDGAVHEGHAQTRRLLGQHFHHQPRGAWSAARRAARLVVIGLVSQRGAVAVERDRQAHELQRGESGQGADRLDIGGVLIHRAARAQGFGKRVEIIAARAARGGMQGLFVGAGAGGGSAIEILRRNHCIDPAPLQFDGGAKAGRAAAEHEGLRAMNLEVDSIAMHKSCCGASRQTLGHVDVRQRVENGLRELDRHVASR